MAKVRTKNYDTKGNETGRVLNHYFTHAFSPKGNFGGGPGLANTLKMVFYHKLGRMLMCMKTRCPGLCDAIYRVFVRGRPGA